MRVTDRMTFDRASVGVGRNQQKVARASQELSTGLRVNHPWDDPAAAGRLVEGQADVARLKGWAGTAGRASDELNSTDSALDDLANLVSRARELAVQMSNGTYSAQDRAGAALEMTRLRESALALANTQVGGRFILGGRADGTAPFDATGAYVGDPGVRRVEVGPGLLVDASVRADVAITGAGGGVDILGTLATLSADLTGNNAAGIRGALDALDTGITQLSQARSDVGAMMSAMSAAQVAAGAQLVHVQSANASLGDVDVVDAASRLALAQRAVEASMTAAQRTFSLSLMERLR